MTQAVETDPLGGALQSIDDLIQLTQSSQMKLATLLLRMAKLEIQIKVNEISPDEVDALRLKIEHNLHQADVIEMAQARPPMRERSRTRR